VLTLKSIKMKKIICSLAATVVLLLSSGLLNASTCPGKGRCVREIGDKEYGCKRTTWYPNCGDEVIGDASQQLTFNMLVGFL
jgi:hypothetical protein